MSNIVGLDLGTNSIGISIRNKDNGKEVVDQLEYFSAVIFKSGVGTAKTGEFSYAAERTKKRSTRRLYQARKYRIWATLKCLIENDCCPLSMEDLEKWSRYDKAQGLKRQYPIHATKFEQWVRLDFDGDGVADYSSPFQLRAELMEKQFDFSNQIDRYKLGRALYHIAQRRGFKSSKGETLKEQAKNECEEFVETDFSTALKKSEEKKSGKLSEYMELNSLPTVGCAFYHLGKNGIRVRNSEYQAVRFQYKDEIRQIFEFQDGLDKESVFYKRLVSEKKGEGTIFYKRHLRSQKGLVGNCTLEPDKPRCPISHPEFEKFRAWCLINNIRFGEDLKYTLTIEQKEQLYKDKFLLTRSSFKFQEIREWIEKRIGMPLDYGTKTINYKDKVSVSGCPISGRMKNLLGVGWENWKYDSGITKTNNKSGEIKTITYNSTDIWHVCFSSFSLDDPQYVEEFSKNKLHFDDNQTKQLVRIFGAIQQGYGMLSLKAIKNINRFLQRGLIYTDAVLLAKLPDIFKDKWKTVEKSIVEEVDLIIDNNRKQKQVYNIVNALIANYKSLEVTEQFAYKNYDYKLDSSDLKDVRETAIKAMGEKTWAKKDVEEQNQLLDKVAELYQSFFTSDKRDYFKLPKVADALAGFLHERYEFLSVKDLRKIYHPSMIEFYAPSKPEIIDDGRCMRLLGSPVIGALKNPMAMRVLHTLRKQVNALLKATDKYGNAIIDEYTRVVVETARELNDTNMRWAIEAYQREREAENKEYEKLLREFYPDRFLNKDDVDIVRLACDQHDIPENGSIVPDVPKDKKRVEGVPVYKKDITKYRLWLEQGCRCLYTGKIINITNLFDDNAFDIEHTIPRSQSFDDSLANLTICDANFNRTKKKNQIPAQLANYDDIKRRLQPWFDKVEQLKDNVEFWKAQSKRAQDKDRKDHCIRQKHLWQMELDYWQNKVDRFTMTEVTSGFRNNQLNDTRIITKYAYHYLKTVFNKVEVQKGSVTANFRKMLGVQSVDEKKCRDKHSHHAIDATILTLIPTAAQRDRMLELFYKIQEKKRFDENTHELERDLEKEIKSCGLSGNVSEIVPFIENNILVNHVSKDQTLTPAKRKARVRGKEVSVKNKQGELVNKWITGDSIRGQLHGETFYGAITQWQKDERGNFLLNEDGTIATNGKVYYVVRRELKYKSNNVDAGFTSWDDLGNAIVDKDLFSIMKGQFSEGTSFKEACAKGIFMFKKNMKGRIDYSEECKVNKIRHIRCYTSVKNPLAIKNQTYMSDKPYKQKYYAEMGDLYVMCKYEDSDKTDKEFRLFGLFDISENRKMGLEDIPTSVINKKGNKTLWLSHQLKRGDMLLLYKDSLDELKDLDNETLSQRLYVIRGFETDGNRIILQKHINAQSDKDLGKGGSIKDYKQMPEKIRCGINTLKYLILGVDFVITSKGIVF
ncbi:MAG: HNH endonuclease domain-containing protein [Bacteroidia bacterium]|nr:HNH endonuclease domain-containing protein [Bacteroidia bacterium]